MAISKQNFIEAINRFDTGTEQIPNAGRFTMDAFLYKNTWYPVKAVARVAYQLAKETPPSDSHSATVRLAELIPYLRFSEMNFQERKPIPFTGSKLNEIAYLNAMISDVLAIGK